jgi:uncharacterized protein involved in exopolysaccharide biosynthesis
MTRSAFNLEQAVLTISRRWKTIFLFVIASGIAATVTVFLVPKYYRSTALVVSANTVLADKSRLFNDHIQNLYSYFGSGDDLDRIYGVGDMDTTYKKLVDAFSLADYYQLTDDSVNVRRQKAVKLLRKDLEFRKTENGQLQIFAWTKEKNLSAKLVNSMITLIEETESAVWEKNYQAAADQINASLASMEKEYRLLSDSLNHTDKISAGLLTLRLQTLADQFREYQKKAGEFNLAAKAAPPVLYVLQAASPAAKAERPDKPAIILAACFAGFVFICLWLLVTDRKPSY